jgi:hypothetical protein
MSAKGTAAVRFDDTSTPELRKNPEVVMNNGSFKTDPP